MTAPQTSLDVTTKTALVDLPMTNFKPQRYRPGHLGTWSGHLAFAYDLIKAITPSLVVELGTHWGESYFTFCQSIFENSLDCRSYAVDHWLGEAHSGLYGNDVFEDVKRHNDAHYGHFSHLLRSTFDEASWQFSDKSIDLLHIDGFHTYEAVSHDFRRWLPKVKPGGIILMHDIDAKHANFGVWRLWEEIQREFSDTFGFHHCWGLGVIKKWSDAPLYQAPLNILFRGSAETQERVRHHYVLYASYLDATLRTSAETIVQIYPFSDNGYHEETSLIQPIGIDQDVKISFYLPHGLGDGPIRIDPAACPGVIEIHKIAIVDALSNALLWELNDPARSPIALTIAGSATQLVTSGSSLLVSYGNDPQIVLPAIDRYEGAARVEITLRIVSSYEVIYEALQLQAGDRARAALQNALVQVAGIEHELSGSRATIEELTAELRESRSERMLMAFETKQAIFDRHAAERELRRVQAEAGLAAIPQNLAGDRLAIEAAQRDLELKRGELASVHFELQSAREQLELERQETRVRSSQILSLETEVSALKAALREEDLIRIGIMRSLSWRVTEPARKVMAALRGTLHRR